MRFYLSLGANKFYFEFFMAVGIPVVGSVPLTIVLSESRDILLC
jgi:hypothetical protein